MYAVLSDRENRYLARHMCWLFTVERMPTYLVIPRDPADLDLLIDTVSSESDPEDLEVVIGVRGPLASPDMCGGMILPLVAFDQLYTFPKTQFLDSIPTPEGLAKSDNGEFRASAAELFDRIMQIADNAGATDEHRALNYLAVRYPAIYATALEAHRQEKTLTQVDVRGSRLAGDGSILDVVFAFTHRRTDVTDKYFARVNVSGEFPFLISKLQPFYER
jgi:hypothetical protein